MEPSGLDREWTDSLTDLLSPEGIKECVYYLTELGQTPLKQCEAVAGCRNPATILVDFHGCYRATVCGEHLFKWTEDVLIAINKGGAYCEECRTIYLSPVEAMTWYRI